MIYALNCIPSLIDFSIIHEILKKNTITSKNGKFRFNADNIPDNGSDITTEQTNLFGILNNFVMIDYDNACSEVNLNELKTEFDPDDMALNEFTSEYLQEYKIKFPKYVEYIGNKLKNLKYETKVLIGTFNAKFVSKLETFLGEKIDVLNLTINPVYLPDLYVNKIVDETSCIPCENYRGIDRFLRNCIILKRSGYRTIQYDKVKTININGTIINVPEFRVPTINNKKIVADLYQKYIKELEY